MAKLGTYSYPDIRFSDAIEISARILNKFKGSIRVKGLAWELVWQRTVVLYLPKSLLYVILD